MYKAQQAAGGAQGQPQPDASANTGGKANESSDVEDVDFEEVK